MKIFGIYINIFEIIIILKMIINNINFIWYIIWSLKSTFKNNYHFGGMCRLTSTVTVDLIEHDDVNGPAHNLVRKRVSGTYILT